MPTMEDKTVKRIDTIARELEKRRSEHGAGTGKSRALRRFVRRLVMIAAIVFFVLAGIFIFNFFRLNSDLVEGHIKQGIIPNLTQGRFEMQIGSVSGNLINGVELENVLISNPHFKSSSTLMTIPRISMNYSIWGIFWGTITMEKLSIENPVLTLKRSETGRAIWDFSVTEDSNEDSEKKDDPNRTIWQKREDTAAMADNYLSDIRIKNLSILIPAPDQLIVDEFLSRLTRFPQKTYQYSGIDLTLKKYPTEQFISHVLSVAMPKDPDFLRFQVTRTKETGNFTVSFDAIGQNFNLAVENLGLDGRKVNFYDGRMKDRLNLEWVLARGRKSLPEKILGLNGVLRVPDFNSIFSGLLAADSVIKGSLEVKVETAKKQPLFDANIDLKISDARLKIPFFPEIQSLNAEMATIERKAQIKNLRLKIKDIESIHEGTVDYADVSDIKGNFRANVMGDGMQLLGRYKSEGKGVHRLAVGVRRNSGEASIELERQIKGKAVIYRDFKIEAGLLAGGKAVEILPLNLLPEELGNQILGWFNRIDLIGPFTVRTSFPTIDDWKKSEIDLVFSGAQIVNRLNPADRVELNGHASLASGVFLLENLRADIENFALAATGRIDLDSTSPFVKDYRLDVLGGVEGGKDFRITSERLQQSLGLAYKPDFDRIELSGKDILTGAISSTNASNSLVLKFDRLRFLRRKKPLWLDKLNAWVSCDAFNLAKKELPGPVSADLDGELFGVNLAAALKANVAAGSIDELSLKGGGKNFSKILEAIVSQPEGQAFFKKHPMNINGAFDFAFLGSGLLKNPELNGWIKFPTLGFSYSDVRAKLPFHALVKTSKEEYVAEINAGEASLKVGQVDFDLGKTSASARVKELFTAADPILNFKAQSDIFSAKVAAQGNIALASKKIDQGQLKLSSQHIENLAKEIARIGQFKIPFELSGRFNAEANIYGKISNPDSHGSIDITQMKLDFPLMSAGKKATLSASQIAGQAEFKKKGNDFFGLTLKKLSGKALGAGLELDGAAHLKRERNGLKPHIEKLNAKLKGLQMPVLANYLIGTFLPPEYSKSIVVDSGVIDGNFSLSGNANKLVAIGQAAVSNGAIGYSALKDKFRNLSGIFKFEGRSDSVYARIAVENLVADFGRSTFRLDNGYIEDPLLSGKIFLDGSVEKVFPADLISLLGGMKIQALSFPEEGWLDGKLKVAGTLFAPMLQAAVSSSKMRVAYQTEGSQYSIPIGENLVEFSYNPGNGEFNLVKGILKFLNGEVIVDHGKGVFAGDKPFSFNATGKITDIDLGQLRISDAESFKGLISGTMKALWETTGARDAVFNLNFKNIFIPKIPIVDPQTIGQVGIDFIEKPDFREGQLNFYVTSEEESGYAGKLLIADGLFAGPHMRLELGNSEFNPLALKISGKLMLNPQSLRHTNIGKKLGKLSATIQDKKTGIPYVDLNLAGTWDKPELMAKSLQKAAEKRGKRNFIRKLFGSRGPHKASVEELMRWFPGWQKGM